jgi:hypothetical protein
MFCLKSSWQLFITSVIHIRVKSWSPAMEWGRKLHPLQCLFLVVAMHMLLGVPISQTSKSVIVI